MRVCARAYGKEGGLNRAWCVTQPGAAFSGGNGGKGREGGGKKANFNDMPFSSVGLNNTRDEDDDDNDDDALRRRRSSDDGMGMKVDSETGDEKGI